MKPLVKLAFFIFFSIFSFSTFALELPTGSKLILDKFVNRLATSWTRLDLNTQKTKLTTMVTVLSNIESSIEFEKQPLVNYLKISFQSKLDNLNKVSEIDLSVYSVSKVDMKRVKAARLKRHNDARAVKGLYAYERSTQLEGTAYNWATYLASINKSTHKRSSTDGYYNYEGIKQRFADQGVEFEGAGTLFTENIAYQYYSCKKDDCTDSLIAAIKKGFNFFMSEAGSNGPHYRGVMSSSSKVIGMGIGIVGTRYYIVTHYGASIKK